MKKKTKLTLIIVAYLLALIGLQGWKMGLIHFIASGIGILLANFCVDEFEKRKKY